MWDGKASPALKLSEESTFIKDVKCFKGIQGLTRTGVTCLLVLKAANLEAVEEDPRPQQKKGQRKITRPSQLPKGGRRGGGGGRGAAGVPWGVAVFGDCTADGFQAEKHTHTNASLLWLKIEPLNRKRQAQGRVTCLAGTDSSPTAPIIPIPRGHI